MKMGTILIIAGVVLIGAGVVINMVGNHASQPTNESVSETKKEVNSESVNPVPLSPEKTETEKPDYKKIGNEFEGYVADILKANGIRLKQWNQGTTSPEGAYAENELNPDFFVSHGAKDKPLEYWVECKYRSNLPNTGFSIEDYQLNRYHSIQSQSKRKIVIALGVGGSSLAPDEFYVIPLDTLYRFKRVGKKYLPNYKLDNPRDNFKNHIDGWFYNDVFKQK